ncbi:MAG: UDP-N-acetylmuramoyl-tripeptide--D-alanyl-D-alanine ligase, partial [Blastocatellia bacterium]
GYSIDSRAVKIDELFLAIRGEKNDGHDYVCQALAAGAIGAVVSREFDLARQIDSLKSSHTVDGGRLAEFQSNLIRVNDTLEALQALASSVIKSWSGKIIAITGSSGKTTTKDVTAGLLSQALRTHKSTGNLNNAYGLPLSILKMESEGRRADDFDLAVLEMGMNHKGEIAALTKIAPPHIGVVTNVNAVHLEFFSSIDDIAEAKAEMVLGVRTGGWAVLNTDDYRVARMRQKRGDIEYRTFGIEEPADVRAVKITADGLNATRFTLVTPNGVAEARVPLIGRHNVYNVIAGVAVAELSGLKLDQVVDGISRLSSSKMRGELVNFQQGFALIDDSYNSNPAALGALVESITQSRENGGRRIVVAGEMLELGEESARLHHESGEKIGRSGVDVLIGVRGLAREIVTGALEGGMDSSRAIFVETPEDAARELASQVRKGDLVLVKGSRGVKMEIVVEKMKQQFERAAS